MTVLDWMRIMERAPAYSSEDCSWYWQNMAGLPPKANLITPSHLPEEVFAALSTWNNLPSEESAVRVLDDALRRLGKIHPKEEVEVFSLMVGEAVGDLWHARMIFDTTGSRATVSFDAEQVLQREERYGDVLGFYHTHPDMPADPSFQDIRTMGAWVDCLGKSLLCLILGEDGLRGWWVDGSDGLDDWTPVQIMRQEGLYFGTPGPEWLATTYGKDEEEDQETMR